MERDWRGKLLGSKGRGRRKKQRGGRGKGTKGSKERIPPVKPLLCSLRVSLFTFIEFFCTFVRSSDTDILKTHILIL